MDFRLTDEQGSIREAIRKFLVQECPRETARELDERAAFPRELIRQIAGLGFCGLNVPEEFGGAGRNLLSSIVVVEELATMAPALAGAFSRIALLGGSAIAEWGSEDQKRKYLPGIASGEILFTFALEPEENALPDARQVTAVEEEGTFRLNGVSKFVALADEAEFILTQAHLSRDISLFIIPAQRAGVGVDEIERIGSRGARLGRVRFEDVAASQEDVLGGAACLNRGVEQRSCVHALGDIEAAALSLGIARGAYDYAVQYAQERIQFGRAIASFEPIQHMLVDIAVGVRASRLLLYQACWLSDEGSPWALEAAVAKAYAVQVARQAAFQCLHILGGYGYMMEYDAQRYVRDALSLLEGSESSEVLKNQVGALLGFAPAELSLAQQGTGQ
jgi:alkylation response protein AidB-like acyl-CoA dehydrogenase